MTTTRKPTKPTKPIATVRAERRMWRVSQRAHRFADRRKLAARRAARGRTVRSADR